MKVLILAAILLTAGVVLLPEASARCEPVPFMHSVCDGGLSAIEEIRWMYCPDNGDDPQ